MSAPLTIVIPTINCADRLGPILRDVFAGVSAGLVARVVFANGGSDDAIGLVAEETGADLVQATLGRGHQLRAACENVTSDWILVLHADSRLPDDWTEIVLGHIQTSKQAAVFRLAFHSGALGAKITAGWANARTRMFSLPYGDQGLLMTTAQYRKIGGYDAIPLMEDVSIARKIRKFTVLPGTVTTSAVRYQRGWFRQGASNLVRLARFFAGADPETLAKGYTTKR